MLKSRVKRLEEQVAKRLEDDKIITIGIHRNALSILKRKGEGEPKSDDAIFVKHPDETLAEFRERLRREGRNMGVWIIEDGKLSENTLTAISKIL